MTEHGDMQAHEETYQLFNMLLKAGIVVSAAIVLLVVWLIAG